MLLGVDNDVKDNDVEEAPTEDVFRDISSLNDISIKIQGCSLRISGIRFPIDLFVLAFEGPDVVLDFPRLHLFGKVTHDYSDLTTKFLQEGQIVTLHGDSLVHSHSMSLPQFQSLVLLAGISTHINVRNWS
ncbi:hypothetical protein KIW84_070009 [Lathyrus oleraceus]|uniref:Uncharacterized protein n=1 Tax=Pisum sativum TaxID=3888 RepID=A0A9D4ZRC4_PEA|nr:hypothetical protein KIW84_070009 [Pisum sativum]